MYPLPEAAETYIIGSIARLGNFLPWNWLPTEEAIAKNGRSIIKGSFYHDWLMHSRFKSRLRSMNSPTSAASGMETTSAIGIDVNAVVKLKHPETNVVNAAAN
jgi:hypothetical protein